MAETLSEDSGVGLSVEASANGHHSLSSESLSEWRSSAQVENGTPSTSLSYWDTDDDDEDYGLKPSQLFGKHIWKIEKFSEIKKRELRSNYFEAGGYKWYILIYPKGCDVCNHLSLFLCVANHDKLLPGWSHFAQFTIAVINKDPKKSKFSDTLHRFWKKEHDWGWKKFMELTKLHDGFIDDSDSLTVEAEVQVIRERVDRPFRCLHCGYRRELVRVYFSNVEQHCRRFVEEKRSKLGRLIEDKARWTSFGVFWLGMDQNSRHRMSREKMDVILKGVVKHFFIEKEVTSTLVMDSLYSGLKSLEGQSESKKARPRSLDAKELPAPIVSVDKDMFILVDDVMLLLERAALEPLPPKENKAPQNRTKDGNDGEEVSNEAVERDERHLTELGRRAVEIFVLAHIFNKIEVAYREAIALKRQEELIREEEEAWLAETKKRAKRGAAEREKKSKKKQAKQKRNKNKGKDKRKEEKLTFATHEKDLEENQHDEEEKDSVTEKAQSSAEKTDTLGDVSDISDSVDGSADILHPDLEDGDSSYVHWDTLEIHHPPPEGSSRGSGISISTPSGIAERKNQSTMDDSSSTCSYDSIRSGVTNGSYKDNSLNFRNQKLPNKGKKQQVKIISDARSLASETDDDQPKSQNSSSESDWVVVSHYQEPESSRNRRPVGKQRNAAQVIMNSVDMDRPEEKSAAVLSSPRTAANNPSPLTQTKLEKKSDSNAEAVPNKKVMLATGPLSSSQVLPPSSDIQSQAGGLKAEMQKIPTPKQPATTTTITRPSSAPLIPAVRPAPIIGCSSVQPTTSLPRSVSLAGRLGPDSSLHNHQTCISYSYKHAIVGNSPGSSSTFNHHPSSHGVVPTTLPSATYTQTPAYQSSFPPSQDGLFQSRSLNSVNKGMNNPYTPAVTSNNSLSHIDIEIARQQAQRLMADEFPHLDIINDLLEDESCSNMVFNGSIFNSQPQLLNSQYSYHGGGADLCISGELLSSGSCRSFGEEGFHYMPRGPYADCLILTQWQMANMDLSLLAMRNRNMEDTTAYHDTYFGLDSSNPSFSSGINGYTEFRASNGH